MAGALTSGFRFRGSPSSCVSQSRKAFTMQCPRAHDNMSPISQIIQVLTFQFLRQAAFSISGPFVRLR